MLTILVAALAAGQAPAATQPAQPTDAKKAKQVCQYMEVTGSRSKKRVCRDADGNLDLGPGVSNSLGGKGRIDQSQGPSSPATY
jgi:hypothetical protein